MVYIYVCKRFKNTMEMVAGKDGKWVDDVLQFYCKHGKLTAKGPNLYDVRKIFGFMDTPTPFVRIWNSYRAWH